MRLCIHANMYTLTSVIAMRVCLKPYLRVRARAIFMIWLEAHYYTRCSTETAAAEGLHGQNVLFV